MRAADDPGDGGADTAARSGDAVLVLPCTDLDAALPVYEALGFRLDMILPADAPRVACLSGHGLRLRLERGADAGAGPALQLPQAVMEAAERSAGRCDRSPAEVLPGGLRLVGDVPAAGESSTAAAPSASGLPAPALHLVRAGHAGGWHAGRAGMAYRDLIPGRIDGRVIASHIRIADGGPVPDYVHYHRVGVQLIYCRRGWVRVVYQDQGPSFVMRPGDCVLQPPTLRHRVLEASAGLEVVELGTPAEHETWRDHALTLPNPVDADAGQRRYGGQAFVRHVEAEAGWTALAEDGPGAGIEVCHTGIAEASAGLARVRSLRLPPDATAPVRLPLPAEGLCRFVYVLDGSVEIAAPGRPREALGADDACALVAGAEAELMLVPGARLLEVRLDARAASPDIGRGR